MIKQFIKVIAGLGTLFQVISAQASCLPQDCSALGYIFSDESLCESQIVRCPFDTSKIFCNTLPCDDQISTKGYNTVLTQEELVRYNEEKKEIVLSGNIDVKLNDEVFSINMLLPSALNGIAERCRKTYDINLNGTLNLTVAGNEPLNIYPDIKANYDFYGVQINVNENVKTNVINFYGNFLNGNFSVNRQSGMSSKNPDLKTVVTFYGKENNFTSYVSMGAADLVMPEGVEINISDGTFRVANLYMKRGSCIKTDVIYRPVSNGKGIAYKYQVCADEEVEYKPASKNSYVRLPFKCTSAGTSENFENAVCKGTITTACFDENGAAADVSFCTGDKSEW